MKCLTYTPAPGGGGIVLSREGGARTYPAPLHLPAAEEQGAPERRQGRDRAGRGGGRAQGSGAGRGETPGVPDYAHRPTKVY